MTTTYNLDHLLVFALSLDQVKEESSRLTQQLRYKKKKRSGENSRASAFFILHRRLYTRLICGCVAQREFRSFLTPFASEFSSFQCGVSNSAQL
jgi:hypothetical protein